MHIPDDPRIPQPGGHYSPIVEHNGVLYVSGQLPIDPETKAVPETIEAQTELALQNMEHLLKIAGSSREHVIQARVYVADVALWDAVNATYAQFFGDHKPARAIVPTGPLHFGCLVEIEAIAFAPER